MNEYVKRILSNLGETDPLASLRSSRDQIEKVVTKIRVASDIDRSYQEGKWTAREIICHLADAEIGVGFRMRQVIAVDNLLVQPFDEKDWSKWYKAADPDPALRSFVASRNWNLEFIERLPTVSWTKPYRHPEQGSMTFDVMVKLLAGHDINHLRQLEIIGGQGGD